MSREKKERKRERGGKEGEGREGKGRRILISEYSTMFSKLYEVNLL